MACLSSEEGIWVSGITANFCVGLVIHSSLPCEFFPRYINQGVSQTKRLMRKTATVVSPGLKIKKLIPWFAQYPISPMVAWIVLYSYGQCDDHLLKGSLMRILCFSFPLPSKDLRHSVLDQHLRLLQPLHPVQNSYRS
jgi:hypothetical protein